MAGVAVHTRIRALIVVMLVLVAAVTCGDNEPLAPTSPTRSLAPGSGGTSVDTPASSPFGWTTAATGLFASMSIDPSVFKGGQSTRGTVTLHEPAPGGGLVVALSSDDTAATVPASMTIAESATGGTFAITTRTVQADVRIGITASAGGSSMTALMRLTPENGIASLTFEGGTRIVGGNSTTGTVTLSSTAPADGVVVRLSSNSGDALVPASITIAANGTSGTFTLETRDVSKDTEAWITASAGRDIREVQIRMISKSSPAATGLITVGVTID